MRGSRATCGRRAAAPSILSGGELTVTLRGQGRGGPNQEYALALAIALGGAPGIAALAADTDGTDGGGGRPEDPAGAFVDATTLARARQLGLDPAVFLADNNSTEFFERLGDLVGTRDRPTPTSMISGPSSLTAPKSSRDIRRESEDPGRRWEWTHEATDWAQSCLVLELARGCAPRRAMVVAAALLVTPSRRPPISGSATTPQPGRRRDRLQGKRGAWTTEGWWNLSARSCETMLRGALVARYYYIYAVDYDRGGEWSGQAFMCTRDKEFTIRGTEDCLARGFDRTGFFEVDTGEQPSWTVQLTESAEQAPQQPAAIARACWSRPPAAGRPGLPAPVPRSKN